MRASRDPKLKRTYKWRNAIERLQHIRHAIERAEILLHGQEWTVTQTKNRLARLEHDRAKVEAGLVRRP